MKKHSILLCSVLAILAGSVLGCSGPAKPAAKPDKKAKTEAAAKKQTPEKPAAKPDANGRVPHRPVVCKGTENIRLEKVKIVTGRVAITASESCDVVIVDSEISADSVAILIKGDGETDIDIRNSVIKGGEAAYVIQGAGDIAAKNTKFIGGRLQGNGTFQDGGGNTWE